MNNKPGRPFGGTFNAAQDGSKPVITQRKGHKTMNKDKLSKLANDLLDAKALADSMTRGDFGGTCNFDSATLLGLRLKDNEIDNIHDITGVRLSRFTWMGRVAYWVTTGTYGQGSDNTKCAEVACELLKSRGWDCTMYYRVD